MALQKTGRVAPEWNAATAGQLDRLLQGFAAQALAGRLGSYTGDGRTGRTVTLGVAAQAVLVLKAKARPADATPTGSAAVALRSGAPVTYAFTDGYRTDAVTAWTADGLTLGPHASVNASGQLYVYLALG